MIILLIIYNLNSFKFYLYLAAKRTRLILEQHQLQTRLIPGIVQLPCDLHIGQLIHEVRLLRECASRLRLCQRIVSGQTDTDQRAQPDAVHHQGTGATRRRNVVFVERSRAWQERCRWFGRIAQCRSCDQQSAGGRCAQFKGHSVRLHCGNVIASEMQVTR